MAHVRIPPFVRKKPAGALAAVQVGADAVFFLRQDEWDLRNYPKQRCPVEMLLGTWEVDGVLLSAFVLRLARADQTTFECQIDISTPPAVSLMQCVAGQSQVDIYVVTDVVARAFRTANSMRLDAGYLVNRARSLSGWTPEAYQAALTRLYKLYTTPAALWRSCLEQAGV